jgi:hypothetical protein
LPWLSEQLTLHTPAFQKQRDELVLRKQAELNIIQKKAKVKKKFDGYDEALQRSFKMKIHR